MSLRPLGKTTPQMSLSARNKLVADLRKQGIVDERVLEVMQKLPRHEFVDESWRTEAYKNKSLPIGQSQTISQPYIVALMTQALLEGATPRKRVLEIGTGSGYQTAVLAELGISVFSVERLKALSEAARERLRALGYRNIHFGYNDGNAGWASHAPYDGVIVTAAAIDVPQALLDQLDKQGRLVIPAGPPQNQVLRVIDRNASGVEIRELAKVNFVPMLEGRA